MLDLQYEDTCARLRRHRGFYTPSPLPTAAHKAGGDVQGEAWAVRKGNRRRRGELCLAIICQPAYSSAGVGPPELRFPTATMRTKQSAEFEKQESTWIYLLHQQAPPQTRLSAEASLSLPPLDHAAPGATASFSESRTSSALPSSRSLLRPPPPTSTMMLLSQDKAWTPTNSLLTLALPRLSDLSSNSTPGVTNSRMTSSTSASPRTSHASNKRACFPKKCDFPMCKNSSRSRGFCYSHGGGRRCCVDGCNNGAVSRDLCKRHGGGRRCRVAECKSSAESGGLCYSHGGGRRCSLSWCAARAKKGGFCAVHLTGDRSQPAEPSATPAADAVHPNVVETLLSLSKDQAKVQAEPETAEPTDAVSPKNAYAIASLLN